MIRRAVRTIRPGTQNRIRRSVLAWRRWGVCSGALPVAVHVVSVRGRGFLL